MSERNGARVYACVQDRTRAKPRGHRFISLARRGTIAIALPAVLAACSTAATTASSAVVVRDSAGITITEHTAAHIASLPTWTIDTTPVMRIDGDDVQHAFTDVVRVTRLADGRILLYDVRHRDVREFGADGAFVRVMMPKGRGPGEVDYVQRIQVLEDGRIAVFDGNQRRISVFTSAGTFAEQIAYPRFDDGSRLGALAVLGDAQLLASMRRAFVPPTVFDGSMRRDTFAVVIMHISGDTAATTAPRVDTIALVPDTEVFDVITTQGGESFPDTDFLRFGPTTNLATNGERLVIGTNEQFELREYRGAVLTRLMRVAIDPEPVPANGAERVRAEVRAGLASRSMPASAREDVEGMMRGWRFATVFPFHDRLLLGDDGTLWAEAPSVWPTDAQRYLVFDAEGRAMARVLLPPRVMVHWVSRERVLGVWTDEDDVPHVRMWRVVEGGPSL